MLDKLVHNYRSPLPAGSQPQKHINAKLETVSAEIVPLQPQGNSLDLTELQPSSRVNSAQQFSAESELVNLHICNDHIGLKVWLHQH